MSCTMGRRMQMAACTWVRRSAHTGHALNKILKDFILRYQILRGRRVHYMPGWDCHGLPIELKAVAEAKEQGTQEMTSTQIREAARKVAYREMAGQRDAFQEFAIMADWSDECTYRTMDFSYEVTQLELFARMVGQGLIEQHFRPVYWSPSSHTALAEAEIEYDERHRSRSAYLAFGLQPTDALRAKLGTDAPVSLAVWTTTPWSLLGNMALAVAPEARYSVVRTAQNQHLVVASELRETLHDIPLGLAVKGERARLGDTEEIASFDGTDLVGSTYTFGLMAPNETREILAAPFVTTTSGTGIVHMAPAHGQEDYDLWRDSGRLAMQGLASPVDDYGRFVPEQGLGTTPALQQGVAALEGQEALYGGNQAILALLHEHGMLLGEQPYRHSYPIDWRTKQPLLVRATAQWFADLSHVGPAAQAALEPVQFVPATGRNRLQSLVGRRSEWCISRQRAWGVPLPVVYNAETGDALLTEENVEHILAVFREHGTMDVWWTLPPETFVAPAYQVPGTQWMVKKDTLDVWFDSGSSWAVLQKALGATQCSSEPCADVYLEGTDQHRGWFQSSLLTRKSACGDGAAAPYANLLTHGFVVDDAGRKMSKSLGNVVVPSTFLHGDQSKGVAALGTDVLRWWAAKTDYTRDIPISPLIMKHASDEVRKLRNTARFLLANLGGVAPGVALPAERTLLDRYVLHELYVLDEACRAAYAEFDFAKVTRRLNEFVTTTLSALYLDVAKDPLYAGGATRPAILAVMDRILYTTTCILAPLLPHLAEDIHWYRAEHADDPKEDDAIPSFFQQAWAPADAAWHDAPLAERMQTVLQLRSDVYVLLTKCKEEQLVKSTPECAVDLVVSPETAAVLHEHNGTSLD